MFLLGAYIPEPPPLVRSLSEVNERISAAMDEDALRAAARTKADYERFTQEVLDGLQELRKDMVSGSVDVETLLHELQGAERQARSFLDFWSHAVRTSSQLVRDGARHSWPADHLARARETKAEAEYYRDTQELVCQAYLQCRRELEAFRKERVAKHLGDWEVFIESLSDDLKPSVKTAWATARALRLWAPESSLTEDGLLMVWDRGRHHIQVEVYPNATFDWFYRDRGHEGYEYGEGIALSNLRLSLAPFVKLLRKG